MPRAAETCPAQHKAAAKDREKHPSGCPKRCRPAPGTQEQLRISVPQCKLSQPGGIQQYTSACAGIAAGCCCRGTVSALFHSLFKRVTTCCRISRTFGGEVLSSDAIPAQLPLGHLCSCKTVDSQDEGKTLQQQQLPCARHCPDPSQLPSRPLLSLLAFP